MFRPGGCRHDCDFLLSSSGFLKRVHQGLKFGLSILYSLSPDLHVFSSQSLCTSQNGGDPIDVSTHVAVALLSVIYKTDQIILTRFSQCDELKSLTGIPKSDALDCNGSSPSQSPSSTDENNSSLSSVSSCPTEVPPSDNNYQDTPSHINPQQHASVSQTSINQACPKQTKLLHADDAEIDELLLLVSQSISILECLIRVLLGLTNNDFDSFHRFCNNEIPNKRKNKKHIARTGERFSSSVLQVVADARPELKCLFGSGVPRCLRMHSLLVGLTDVVQSRDPERLDKNNSQNSNQQSPLQSDPAGSLLDSSLFGSIQQQINSTFVGVAVAITTAGLGILADDARSVFSRVSAVDGFRVLLHLKQFNSNVLLLGLQKPIMIEEMDSTGGKPVVERTYISKSGKKKKVPGFRSSVGESQLPVGQASQFVKQMFADKSQRWLPLVNGRTQQLFVYCKSCNLQVRRTTAEPDRCEERRIEQQEYCMGCGNVVSLMRDVTIGNQLESRDSDKLMMGVNECNVLTVSERKAMEEGEIVEDTDEMNIGTKQTEKRSPIMTSECTAMALAMEKESRNGLCCWIRPPLSSCVSQTLQNVEDKEAAIQKLLREHLTFDLIRKIMSVPETFVAPTDLKMGATFYPPGVSITHIPPMVDWSIVTHGWILRLLDDYEDVGIRIGVLDLLGELFTSRPLEYRTWHVRSLSHIPIIASIHDFSPDVAKAALRATVRSTTLAPLKDGGVRRLVKPLEVEDFDLRLYIIRDIFCAARFSDKAIRILIRGIMFGNSTTRLLFYQDCWSRLRSLDQLKLKLSVFDLPQPELGNDLQQQQQLFELPCYSKPSSTSDLNFYLDWGLGRSHCSSEMLLWICFCAKICCIIGLNHPYLYESVVSTLPELQSNVSNTPSNKDESPTQTGASKPALDQSDADAAVEVVGVAAFLLGASMLLPPHVLVYQCKFKGWEMKMELEAENRKRFIVIKRPAIATFYREAEDGGADWADYSA